MQIPKTNIEIGDRVKYKHPLPHPFEGLHAYIEGNVIDIVGNQYQIFIRFDQTSESRIIKLIVPMESLKIVETIPDPNWLSNKIAKADKICESSYSEAYIFDPHLEKYFETSEDLLEHYESEDIQDSPSCAFGTFKKVFKISEVEDLTSSLLDYSEDEIDLVGIEKLQAAIDEFNILNQSEMTSYHPDYRTVVTFQNILTGV